MSQRKNDWQPNAEQRAVLLQLKAESEGNQAEFHREYGNETIGSAGKLSQILDALEEGRVSYFNKIHDPEALMEDLIEFMDNLPRQKRQKFMAVETVIHPLSYFEAAVKAARRCKDRQTPERCLQYIGPTGASKSTLYAYLRLKLKNDFTLAFVNCRDSWRPASPNLRQRAKLVVLQDLCDGLKIRLPEELRRLKLEDAPAIEDLIVDNLQKRSVLMYLEEGRFLRTYALNLFIDLLNRTRVVLLVTNTPVANRAIHQYCPDEADQLDRRSAAVIRVSKIAETDAGMFFEAGQFEDREAALTIIADSASQFGHFSLISRVQKRLAKTTGATLAEVEAAITKAGLEMNRHKQFARRA